MHPLRHRLGRVIAFIALSVAIVAAALCWPTLAAGAPKSDAKPADPAEARHVATLAKCWGLLYARKYDEGFKAADALTKLGDPRYLWLAAEAGHIQARCALAQDTPPSRARAGQIWAALEKSSPLEATKARARIRQALEKSAGADPATLSAAIGTLEEVVKAQAANTATLEATLELAMLYGQANQFPQAFKTAKSVEGLLGKTSRLRAEMPGALAKAFTDAAHTVSTRLEYMRDAGRAQFEKAEKLRKADKFAEAAAAYQAVVKEFPTTDYAHRSDLNIGLCLLGLNQQPAAVEHWKKFVQAMPAGPWRGQAYLHLIDILLEDQLDLAEAGKYAELARTSLPAALKDDKAAESWKDAAYDLHVRVGVVSFCQSRGEQAAEAFAQARKLTKDKLAAESLETLIAAAKANKGIIPEDCRGAGDSASPAAKVSLALSMGVIYNLADRPEKAFGYFERVTGRPAQPKDKLAAIGPMPGATPAQQAFATFGKGMVLQSQNKDAAARDAFETSLKAHPAGSWHDETLYRVATIIDEKAKSSTGFDALLLVKGETIADVTVGETKNGMPKPEVDSGQTADCWAQIVDRFPASARREEALLRLGDRLQGAARWADAYSKYDRLTDEFPSGYYSGEAYVWKVDILLERMGDIDNARKDAASAAEWAAKLSTNNRDQKKTSDHLAWQLPQNRNAQDLDRAKYECHLRDAIIAILDGNNNEALKRLDVLPMGSETGNPFLDDRSARQQGIRFLAEALRNNEKLVKDAVVELAKNDRQRLLLRLAAIYFRCMQFAKSAQVTQEMLAKRAGSESVSKPLHVYAITMIASCLLYHADTRAEAVKVLEQVQDRQYYGLPTTAQALLLLAVAKNNIKGEPSEAMSIFSVIVNKYGDTPEAERAMYFQCVLADAANRKAEARRYGQAFLTRYPKSDYAKHVMNVLATLDKKE